MKYYLSILLIIAGLLAGYGVYALNADDIVYPIAQLGNCETKETCKAYCSDSEHMSECIAFAAEYELMSSEELERARQFESIGGVGPGGCTNEFECQFYCENINNIEECVDWAEENGMMDEHELAEARMIMRALEQGAVLPGGCSSEVECMTYCEDMNNMQECIAFAEAAGFMEPDELREAKQVLRAIESGVSPPGDCRGERECDEYCAEPAHAEECVEFAIAAGFISPEEAEEMKKILPLMKSGRMPEWCQDKEQCETYCADESNIDECTAFFVEAGFMSAEEAEMFKRTGGKGPGDCKGKEECELYCNDPANQEVCFEFAKEHGFISEEEIRGMEEGVRQFQDWFETAPPEVAQCLRQQVGDETLQEIQAGTFMPGPDLIGNLEQCFQLQQQVAEDQMRACLSLSCDEIFTCMGSIAPMGGGGSPVDGGGPGEGDQGHPGDGIRSKVEGALEQEIQAKMDMCMVMQFEQDRQDFIPPDGEYDDSEYKEFGDFKGDSSEFDNKIYDRGEDGQFPTEDDFFFNTEGDPFRSSDDGQFPPVDAYDSVEADRIYREAEERIRMETEQRIRIEIEQQIIDSSTSTQPQDIFQGILPSTDGGQIIEQVQEQIIEPIQQTPSFDSTGTTDASPAQQEPTSNVAPPQDTTQTTETSSSDAPSSDSGGGGDLGGSILNAAD